jgi:ribonuclease HI
VQLLHYWGKIYVKKLIFIFSFIMLLPLLGNADIIFFKDGMKTVCQGRAWKEGQEVKCEYEGTVIIYQWKDVLRIQEIRTEKKAEPPSDKEKKPAKPAVKEAVRTDKGTSPASQPKLSAEKELKTVSTEPAGASRAIGLEFYNPRRPLKYWTSATSKHQTFKEAIAALAKQYDRSPQWIQQHMGETNDLDEMHRNLASSRVNAAVDAKAAIVKKSSDTVFYNPRRPHKYWTSATAKHKTFKEAISALSAKYERPAQWVQEHMGDSNNLSEIHQNLKNQKLLETSP